LIVIVFRYIGIIYAGSNILMLYNKTLKIDSKVPQVFIIVVKDVKNIIKYIMTM